jgi:hypothetical protein
MPLFLANREWLGKPKTARAKQFGSPRLTGQKFWPTGGLSPGGRVMPTHDPLSDRLVVESMATALDLHAINLNDATAVAGCLLRAGYPGKTIGRLAAAAIQRACELATLRTTLAPAIDGNGEAPPAANAGTPQQATR